MVVVSSNMWRHWRGEIIGFYAVRTTLGNFLVVICVGLVVRGERGDKRERREGDKRDRREGDEG